MTSSRTIIPPERAPAWQAATRSAAGQPQVHELEGTAPTPADIQSARACTITAVDAGSSRARTAGQVVPIANEDRLVLPDTLGHAQGSPEAGLPGSVFGHRAAAWPWPAGRSRGPYMPYIRPAAETCAEIRCALARVPGRRTGSRCPLGTAIRGRCLLRNVSTE